jgi:DNA-binding MarR family transcriptional regulator
MLRVVLAKPGVLPHELAEVLSLFRSTGTRFLDSLEKRGFLIRKMTTQDGREVQIYPTKSALAIHKKLEDTGNKLSKLMSEMIPQEELSQIVSSLREFQKILDAK